MSGSLSPAFADAPNRLINPLDVYRQTIEAQGNALDVRQKAANQAASQVLQQATDKNTGVTDYLLAAKLAAHAGPEVGIAMSGLLKDASGLRGAQTKQASDLFDLTARTSGDIMNDASDENLDRHRTKLLAVGVPQATVDADYQQYKALDEAGRKALAYSHLNATLDASQAFARSPYPMPTLQNQGNAFVPTVTRAPTPQQPGGMTVAPGGLPLNLTPEQWNAQIPGYKNPATGQPEFKTVGQLLTEQGFKPPSGVNTAPAPGATGAPAPSTTAAPTPGATTAPKATVPTGPRPDDEARWKASSDLYARDLEASTTYQQRIFPLVQVASILASGDVTTGQGADALNRAKSFLQTMATSMGWDAQTIQQAKYDEVAKYMQQYVNAQGMSARSDQALASAITGNPSSHLSTLANKEVVKPLLAIERMKQMALADFKASGGHGNDYTTFLNEWQNTHDPRAFLVDQLDKPHTDKMLAGMSKDDRIRFDKTLRIVEANPGIMGQAVMPR